MTVSETLIHSCIWAFMAETEMESDRHTWAFDSETHISTFRELPVLMAVVSIR